MIKTKEWFEENADRYKYDFVGCRSWTQLDTSKDASYYGNWVCPKTLQIMSFVEGDCTLYECETKEEFVAKLNKILEWHKENLYQPRLDAVGWNRKLLEDMGFKKWFPS